MHFWSACSFRSVMWWGVYLRSCGICSRRSKARAGYERELIVAVKRALFMGPNFRVSLLSKLLLFMQIELITCCDTLLPGMLNNDHLVLTFSLHALGAQCRLSTMRIESGLATEVLCKCSVSQGFHLRELNTSCSHVAPANSVATNAVLRVLAATVQKCIRRLPCILQRSKFDAFQMCILAFMCYKRVTPAEHFSKSNRCYCTEGSVTTFCLC